MYLNGLSGVRSMVDIAGGGRMNILINSAGIETGEPCGCFM